MKRRSMVLLGGDLRQYYMANSLVKRGFAISYYGLLFPKELPGMHCCKDKEELWEKLCEKNTILVLPVPCTLDGMYLKSNSLPKEMLLLEEIVAHVEKGQNLFGGRLPVSFQRKIEGKGAKIVDISKSDAIVMNDAAATAEGAIVEAELLSDETIFGSRSLVLGFDRYGKILAKRLRALGSHVTIAAGGEEAKTQAQLSGYMVTGIPPEKTAEDNWNFVFHTASEFVLDARALNVLEPEVVIIDITSKAEGVDYDYARKQGITAKHCFDLPGKYAAKTAGEMLAEELEIKLKETKWTIQK